MSDKLFQVEAMIAATLYIKADTLEDALAKAAALKGQSVEAEDAGGDVAISGLQYEDPDLPEISFSPSMTIHDVDATGYQSAGPEDDE